MQEKKPSFHAGKNLIVAAVIAALALGLFILSRVTAPKAPDAPLPTQAPGQEETAEAPRAFLLISVGGRPQSVEPLDRDRDVEITQPTGEKNVVHITRDGFHMASSTCENQLCISQGEVTAENYTRRILGPYVLCLPNQVELELVIPGATASPDALDH